MASICILFFCYLFVMRKRLFKTQMLKERLLNEREQEKEKREKVEEVQKEFARRIDELEKVKKSGVEPLIYRLSSELTFHAYKKLLVWNGGQTILLSSQNTILLTAFLEAPECTLSYDELFKCLWPDGSGNMSRLRVAVGRLRDALKVDPGISILQHDVDRYQLFLPENS